MGGDYYGFVPLNVNAGPAEQRRLAILLGDVAGKGVPAALLMAKLSSDARFCLLSQPNLAAAVTALARGLTLEIVAGTTVGTFKLVIRQAGSLVEPDMYDNLTLTNVERRVNGISHYIRVRVVSATAPVPTTATVLPFFALSGGWAGLVGRVINDRAAQPTLSVAASREGVSIDIADATSDRVAESIFFSRKATRVYFPGASLSFSSSAGELADNAIRRVQVMA